MNIGSGAFTFSYTSTGQELVAQDDVSKYVDGGILELQNVSAGTNGLTTYVIGASFPISLTADYTYDVTTDTVFGNFNLGGASGHLTFATYTRGTDNLDTTATPLPAALPLFATGVGGLGLLGWRRKRKAQAV